MTDHIRLEGLLRELRMALRVVAHRPGFSAAVFATLALAIGAPTAIFSVVHAVLLRPLPYSEPDRILTFRMEGTSPRGPVSFDAVPASEALRWAQDTRVLSALALYNDQALTLSAGGPFRLAGTAASPSLFSILGVSPARGASFDPVSTDPHRVLLSYETWLRYFSGAETIVGSTIALDGRPYRVTGVMPEGFAFPDADTAFWVPLFVDQGSTRGMLLPVIARLAPGAELAAAVEEARRTFDTIDGPVEHRILVRTIQDQMVGGVRRLLWVLMAAVTVVFVLGSTNIAMLLLTRGATREREFSIRLALGAARARLAGQLLLEGLAYAVPGGLLGVGFAAGALAILPRFAPAAMPRLHEVRVDGTVLAFAGALTLLTTVVFGVLSAGRMLRADPAGMLARPAGGSGSIGGPSRVRLNLLAAVQLALTVVLLVGAGLLLRSFVRQALVDQGFRDRGAVALQISLPSARYPSPAARVAFHERLLERLTAVRGIDAAGIITMMPNRQPSARFAFSAEPLPEPFDPMTASVYDVRTASEGFFEAMGIPLLAGRTFEAGDRAGTETVVVISRRLATSQFGDRNPVGEVLYSGQGTFRVAGVVGDVRPAAGGRDGEGAAYLPFRQNTDVFRWFATATVVARASDPRAAAADIRSLVLSLDPEMPTFNVRTLSEEVARLLAGPRFSASLLSIFAFAALLLAAVGIYGVMTYAGRMRTREIGVRMALGATRASVLRLMMRDGVLVVSLGLLAGGMASSWMSGALEGLLVDVAPADPVALAGVAALLFCIGLAAAFLPAHRATRVSAIDALREP